MKKKSFLLLLLIAVAMSCAKKDNKDNTDTAQGVLGQVGNEWKMTCNGNSMSARIIENIDGFIKLVLQRGSETDTIQLRLTENAVYEYVHSGGDTSKPFTMVEFDATVGDFYTMTMGEYWFERYVSERETYYIPCLGKDLETIGVYEDIPSDIDIPLFDCTIRSIIWYWHQYYGLVCVEIYTDECGMLEFTFVSIDL